MTLSNLETVQGLRLLLGNATLQTQHLHDAMVVGADVRQQAETALGACDLAHLAIEESDKVLRKLAGLPTKTGRK